MMRVKPVLKRVPYLVKTVRLARVLKHRAALKLVKPPTWRESLTIYEKWADAPLPEDYRKVVVNLAERFRKFSDIKKEHLVLDVGCGTNMIGGMTYKEFFGWDDAENPRWRGLDPLQGRATHIGVAENMCMFQDNVFDRVQINTSLDHFENWRQALRECLRVLKPTGELNIWFSETSERDHVHTERVFEVDIRLLLFNEYGVKHVETLREQFRESETTDTIFMKIKGVENKS